MDGATQPCASEMRNGCQHDGNEALHVGRAAPIQPAVALGQGPGVAAPRLPFHRYHIDMPREDDAAGDRGSDGCVQVGLQPVRRRDELAVHAVLAQVGLAERDQLQVAGAGHGSKRDEAAQEIADGL